MKLSQLHEAQGFDLEKFKQDCAPFLKELKEAGTGVLYHGSNNHPTDWEIRDFKERSGSRDTPDFIHDELNDLFKEKYGYEFRKWLFTTGSKRDARMYGPITVIFPIGPDYHYIWSPYVEDMSTHRAGYVDKVRQTDRHLSYDDQTEKANDEFLHDMATVKFHVDANLGEGLESHNEIHLKCDKFYIFKWIGDTYEQVIRPFIDNEILNETD